MNNILHISPSANSSIIHLARQLKNMENYDNFYNYVKYAVRILETHLNCKGHRDNFDMNSDSQSLKARFVFGASNAIVDIIAQVTSTDAVSIILFDTLKCRFCTLELAIDDLQRDPAAFCPIHFDGKQIVKK